jgi:hypothetical protein
MVMDSLAFLSFGLDDNVHMTYIKLNVNGKPFVPEYIVIIALGHGGTVM